MSRSLDKHVSTSKHPPQSSNISGERRRLTSLGNGTRSVPPSHTRRYLDLEVERLGLEGSFLISGLKESVN
ncbi:hypothetical protein TNCV_3514111 [Trichonephila clavipes]|nr:hypothetical protein TNCV_3514111 [Trichonephila clavipes]